MKKEYLPAYIKETGWDEDGNCLKCGEAGQCHCNNHFITGIKHNGKPERIRRVPYTSPMFARYSPDKTIIYHVTGDGINAVGSLDFVLSHVDEKQRKETEQLKLI